MTKHFHQHKEIARKTIYERVQHFAAQYNVPIKRIAIRNQRTRWGSCSKAGNLNFNYRIIFLPAQLMDYVIAHEICHLLEFNHSHKFWEHVQKTFPNYKLITQQFRKINMKALK